MYDDIMQVNPAVKSKKCIIRLPRKLLRAASSFGGGYMIVRGMNDKRKIPQSRSTELPESC